MNQYRCMQIENFFRLSIDAYNSYRNDLLVLCFDFTVVAAERESVLSVFKKTAKTLHVFNKLLLRKLKIKKKSK